MVSFVKNLPCGTSLLFALDRRDDELVVLLLCCCVPEFVPGVYGLLERDLEDVLGLVEGDDDREE